MYKYNKRKTLLSAIFFVFISLILFYSFEADFIICTVNEIPITYVQFIRELNRYKIALIAQGQKIPDNVEEVVLNNLIEINLVVQAAKEKGIFVSDDDVKISIDSIKKRYSITDQQFIKQLKMEGFTYDEFFNNYKNQMIKFRFLNIYIKKKIKKPNENEICNFYTNNIEKFKGSKKYDVIIFYIELGNKVKLFDKLNAKKLLEKFNKEVTINNYQDLLKKYNNDAKNEIKYYNKIIYPEIEDPDFVKVLVKEADKTKTSVFYYKNNYYFYIIKNQFNIEYIPLETVKGKIINYLEQMKIEKKFKEWMENEKNNAIIKWYRKDVIENGGN